MAGDGATDEDLATKASNVSTLQHLLISFYSQSVEKNSAINLYIGSKGYLRSVVDASPNV